MRKLLPLLFLLLIPVTPVVADMSPMDELEKLLEIEAQLDDTHPDYIKIVDGIADRTRFLDTRAANDTDYILVNIGSQRLLIIDDLEVASTQRVIVGRDSRPTPIFSDEIKYIVSRPYWNVPRSLATKDVLPKLKDNPRLIDRDGFEMVSLISGEVVHPFDVNMDLRRYRLRQRPGNINALGDVKFMFDPNPNRAIYLHDTPTQSLFENDVRRYSSGCIRVSNPGMIELFLMKGQDIPESNVPDRWVRTPVATKVHIVEWPIYYDGDELILDDTTGRTFKMPDWSQQMGR